MLCFDFEQVKVLPLVNVQGNSCPCDFGARHTATSDVQYFIVFVDFLVVALFKINLVQWGSF